MKIILNIKKLLKSNKYIYSLKTRLLDKDYKAGREEVCQAQLSADEMKRQTNLLKNYWKVPADHYYRYKLYNQKLSDSELIDYIPPFVFYSQSNRFVNSANVKELQRRFDDKFELYKIFKSRGVNTPEVIALIEDRVIKQNDGSPMRIEKFKEAIGEECDIFIKPVDGRGGSGIVKLHYDGTDFSIKGQVNSIENIVKKMPKKLYVVQKGIIQHGILSEINSSSVNTLRAIIYNDGENVELVAVALRIGRTGSPVDNSAKGGLSVEIDVENGKLADRAVTEHPFRQYDRHPDTGFVFKDKFIAGWQDIKHEILEYSAKFPELVLYGWDVAIEKSQDETSRITMIELNVGFGIDHLQLSCGGMRRRLNKFLKPVIDRL